MALYPQTRGMLSSARQYDAMPPIYPHRARTVNGTSDPTAPARLSASNGVGYGTPHGAEEIIQ